MNSNTDYHEMVQVHLCITSFTLQNNVMQLIWNYPHFIGNKPEVQSLSLVANKGQN